MYNVGAKQGEGVNKNEIVEWISKWNFSLIRLPFHLEMILYNIAILNLLTKKTRVLGVISQSNPNFDLRN